MQSRQACTTSSPGPISSPEMFACENKRHWGDAQIRSHVCPGNAWSRVRHCRTSPQNGGAGAGIDVERDNDTPGVPTPEIFLHLLRPSRAKGKIMSRAPTAKLNRHVVKSFRVSPESSRLNSLCEVRLFP